MGDDPQWAVVKKEDSAPEGYYLADMSIVDTYYDQLVAHADEVIGEWAIVGFNGGKFEGSGYGNVVVCEDGCEADPLYDVIDNENISDVLVVAA